MVRLVIDGIITNEVAENFRDHHACMLVAKEGGFKSWLERMRTKFGLELEDKECLIQIVRLDVRKRD